MARTCEGEAEVALLRGRTRGRTSWPGPRSRSPGPLANGLRGETRVYPLRAASRHARLGAVKKRHLKRRTPVIRSAAHTIVFFVAIQKQIPIPSGGGYVFGPEARPRERVDPPEWLPPPVLPAPGPNGVGIRFWQMSRPVSVTLAPHDQLDRVLRTVVPPRILNRRTDTEAPYDPELFDTVVEMATPLMNEPDPVQQAFRRCWRCVEDVHRAFCASTQAHVAPLNVGDIHIFAMFITRQFHRWQPTLSMYLIPGNTSAWIAPELTTPQDYEGLHVRLRRLREGDPFSLFAERARLGQTATERGEFADAIVNAAVSMEILLDGLLGLMLWEEGASITAAAEALSKPLADRVRSEYHGRLGGAWNSNANPAVHAWIDDIQRVRGRVVHRGYRPTEEEAWKANAAATNLEEFIRSRLIERRTVYMRTTLMWLGLPGLARRGLWNGKIRRWFEGSTENSDDWIPTYEVWRTQVDAVATP